MIAPDSPASAKQAGLRYVDDRMPGIRRIRRRGGFRYVGSDGRTIDDPAELERIRAIAVPPAYDDVWICPLPNGHIQATARDARGRKQYRYHPAWRATRDATKFEATLSFARALPHIRRRVEADLATPKLTRACVLAAVVRLLETTLIRIGNEEYARANASFGLTTLRERHVSVAGPRLRFRFRGKSGVEHRITIDDRRLASVVRRCKDLPGEELFSYREDDGTVATVHADDVNAYLREISGGPFPAKDFRTWAATVACAFELQQRGVAESQADAKRRLKDAVAQVASKLGNSAAVCRNAYVHPTVVETYLDRLRLDLPALGRHPRNPTQALTRLERAVAAFIRRTERAREGATLAALRRSLRKTRSRTRRSGATETRARAPRP